MILTGWAHGLMHCPNRSIHSSNITLVNARPWYDQDAAMSSPWLLVADQGSRAQVIDDDDFIYHKVEGSHASRADLAGLAAGFRWMSGQQCHWSEATVEGHSISQDWKQIWWSGSRAGAGVTNVPFINFSECKIFDLAKEPVRFFGTHLYLTGVTAAQLRRHLSNINVILNS